jgi:hydroxyacylglutathione hydrolase
VTAEELERRIKAKEAPVIFDVRSDIEFKSGHIAGAIHAPLVKILRVASDAALNKADLIILTCEHGPRAQLAKSLLKWRGYTKIELLEGHMSFWRRAGKSVRKYK